MTTMPTHTATTNACKLCTPLGATLAFRGIEGAVPFLHGSQGCATYMRRYIISHFNEPMDIASSALGEKHAIFGGGPNLKQGLANVTKKYNPAVIGIATTCLTETIGDDVPSLLTEYRRAEEEAGRRTPVLVPVATPSYNGSHMEGFHAATRATAAALAAAPCPPHRRPVLLPGLVSPADIRHLKDCARHFGLEMTVLPDYSATLDGPALAEYQRIPSGGTPLAEIRALAGAPMVIECATAIDDRDSTGVFLNKTHGVPLRRVGMPVGIRSADRLFTAMSEAAECPLPAVIADQRGRLIDALADGHKYVFGKRAVVYGEEDLVAGITAFLAEIGVRPVLCASGGRSGRLRTMVEEACGGLVDETPQVLDDADFHDIETAARALKPDLLIGHSKGYRLARDLGIPLVRAGFPIHDRLGGQRLLHVGYAGALALFDTIVNTLLARKQEGSEIGYSYM